MSILFDNKTQKDPPWPHPGVRITKTWWRGEDLNLRRRCQQIYSLPPLATRVPLRPTILPSYAPRVTKNLTLRRYGGHPP